VWGEAEEVWGEAEEVRGVVGLGRVDGEGRWEGGWCMDDAFRAELRCEAE
jgi:hypothetical protein